MSARELLPCPFCGGEARVRSYRTSEDSMGTLVGCLSCFAETDEIDAPYAEHAQAVAMWNRRAPFAPVSTSAPKETSAGIEPIDTDAIAETAAGAWRIGHPNTPVPEAGIMTGILAALTHLSTPEPAEPRRFTVYRDGFLISGNLTIDHAVAPLGYSILPAEPREETKP